MGNEGYIKLKTRLIGAINNALSKDPKVTELMLKKAFLECCFKLKQNGKL